MLKDILKKSWPHLVAIGIFLVVTMVYFSPALSGYGLKQHDIKQFKGSAKEIRDYREDFGEEPLWTNSQFGGMPATQISVRYSNNFILSIHRAYKSMLPHPINAVFLYFLGFYIMLLCFKVDPWLSIIGALAFGFSSYFFIILEAGHNTKAWAIGYMPPVIGGFYMAYRRKMILGAAITALFFAFQLSVNHPQVTYYMGFLLLFMGVVEMVRYIKKKELLKFGKITGLLLVGAFLGILANSGRLYMTQEYLKDSQRGPTELTEKTLGKEGADVQTGGLDLEYMTRWSYGKEETYSLMIPNVKGRASGPVPFEDLQESDPSPELLRYAQGNLQQSENESTGVSEYWGEQPVTSGPVYVGAGLVLLALLALFIVKDWIKWPLLVITLLSIALAWGKNWMDFTRFFANNVPFYDSFRAVTIILVMVEFAIPLLAILGLRKIIKDRDEFSEEADPALWIGAGLVILGLLHMIFLVLGVVLLLLRAFKVNMKIPLKLKRRDAIMVVSGLFALVLLVFMITPGTFFDFLSSREIEQYGNWMKENPQQSQAISGIQEGIKDYRIGVFKADVLRSLGIVIFTMAFVVMYLRGVLKKSIMLAGIGLVTVIDLAMVDQRYLNNESPSSPQASSDYKYWIPQWEKEEPFEVYPADKAILNNEVQQDDEIAQAVQEAEAAVQKELQGEEEAQYVARKTWSEKFQALNFNSNYRVLEYGVFEPKEIQESTFNSSRSSYFHKSIGGYSAIKLKRANEFVQLVLSGDQNRIIQNMQQLQQGNANQNKQVLGQALAGASGLNMLNTRYIILNKNGQGGYYNPMTAQEPFSGAYAGLYNPFALGPAWLVEKVKTVQNADEEIQAVRQSDPSKTAVVDTRFSDHIEGAKEFSGEGSIVLEEYRPNYLKYSFKSDEEQFVAFSEVYYEKGWTAYIDGEQAPHIRINYILRGMKVPAGEHTIEFKYHLDSYEKTQSIALAGSGLILLFFLGALFFDFKKSRDKD